MLQIKLNNRYMDVKIRSGSNELTIEYIDSDLSFLMNWINKTRDPINGMICKKVDYVEDIYFKRIPDNIIYFHPTKGILRNCSIKEIDFKNMIFILEFDYLGDYDPIEDRNKKLNKIIKRLC